MIILLIISLIFQFHLTRSEIIAHKDCSFPFSYANKTYTECLMRNNSLPLCKTKEEKWLRCQVECAQFHNVYLQGISNCFPNRNQLLVCTPNNDFGKIQFVPCDDNSSRNYHVPLFQCKYRNPHNLTYIYHAGDYFKPNICRTCRCNVDSTIQCRKKRCCPTCSDDANSNKSPKLLLPILAPNIWWENPLLMKLMSSEKKRRRKD
ncbi:hypothetical protein SNEBB_000352 [Seison nebaliae]|nr:hypothetical protein SNEBB_000352 [Seison nebaliae]